MIFDESYNAWVAAERAARDANDRVFHRVHGEHGRMTSDDCIVLNTLRSDARAKMDHMLRAATGHAL